GTFVNERRQPQIWCDVETDWNGLLISRDGARIEILADHAGVPLPHAPHAVGTISPSYRHLRRRHSRDGKAFL
ncbi:hypothetical protein, partial [Klebsiella aerogenes]|uniref:hypothetical protein n=1 Tax=Klebsiella aerogenes TaxID=548 RepID=UPI00195403A3